MTRDDIIRMAKEAGMKIDSGNFADDMYVSVLYRFAHIVAAAEREACAKLIEEVGRQTAISIRARGEK
jgi:hypothetical protein